MGGPHGTWAWNRPYCFGPHVEQILGGNNNDNNNYNYNDNNNDNYNNNNNNPLVPLTRRHLTSGGDALREGRLEDAVLQEQLPVRHQQRAGLRPGVLHVHEPNVDVVPRRDGLVRGRHAVVLDAVQVQVLAEQVRDAAAAGAAAAQHHVRGDRDRTGAGRAAESRRSLRELRASGSERIWLRTDFAVVGSRL